MTFSEEKEIPPANVNESSQQQQVTYCSLWIRFGSDYISGPFSGHRPFFSSQSHIFDWEISDWKNWWFQPFDEKFHLKKDKKSAPHSPQKKRRPKRENGIDVFEIRRRRKEREKKGETICGARSQRGRLKTSENFFLRLHQRFFLLLPEKKRCSVFSSSFPFT